MGGSEILDSKTYFIENRDQQIAYKKYGLQGDETIVFQHGLTSKKEDWDAPDTKGAAGGKPVARDLVHPVPLEHGGRRGARAAVPRGTDATDVP